MLGSPGTTNCGRNAREQQVGLRVAEQRQEFPLHQPSGREDFRLGIHVSRPAVIGEIEKIGDADPLESCEGELRRLQQHVQSQRHEHHQQSPCRDASDQTLSGTSPSCSRGGHERQQVVRAGRHCHQQCCRDEQGKFRKNHQVQLHVVKDGLGLGPLIVISAYHAIDAVVESGALGAGHALLRTSVDPEGVKVPGTFNRWTSRLAVASRHASGSSGRACDRRLNPWACREERGRPRRSTDRPPVAVSALRRQQYPGAPSTPESPRGPRHWRSRRGSSAALSQVP